MEAHNICSSAIVAQVLTGKDNYENWKACIKNYLWVRDLWDVVEQTSEPSQPEEEAEFKAWSKRNVAALHAIQISCDPFMLSFLRNMTTAKDAWKTLARLCQVPEDAPEIPEDRHVERKSTAEFLEAIRTRHLEKAKKLLRANPHLAYTGIRAMADLTIFHFAIFEGQLEMIDEFVSTMSKEHLGMVDRGGNTVLHYVALCSENTEIAQRLITKNEELLTVKNGAEDIPLDRRGDIPLNFACLAGHKDMTHYLYNMTTPGFLIEEENKRQAVLVVHRCISNKWFDVALDLLRRRPQLAFAKVDGMNAVSILSSQPSAFPSGSRLSFRQRCIYSCLNVKQPTSEDDVRINTYEVQDQRQMTNFTTQDMFCSVT
ncbi:PREDICTED: uncharacterized protein LOC108663895 [Theobroma cacao]|uniref:Uncharacterized protein LOC108663895 n=1 Tax=Theobroma cacao TaxID=3641 RepID=A0AB32X3K3_THECC|nr:PREDICTED: uncharacterized protein LOC108663895 [Theobroma cacao]